MNDADAYPWNVEIDVGGVTFSGPGMDGQSEAEAIKGFVEGTEGVDRCEVVRQ